MADDITDVLKEVGILTKLVKSLKTSNKDLKQIKKGGSVDVKGDKKEKLESEFKREEGIIVTGFSTNAIEQLKLISPAAGDSKKDPVKSAKKSGGLMDGIMAVVGVGLGVAGLLGAMAGVDALAGAIGTGDNLKSLMQNLAEGLGAFSGPSMIALGALLGAGALFGTVGGMGTAFKAAVGMSAIGLGLGGFFAGLALADAGASFLKSDGSTIKALMVNLAEGLGAFDGPGMIALGTLLGAGAIFGAVSPVVAGQAALGMTAIGAGLGGFFAGMALADKGSSMLNSDGSTTKALMVNLAEGLNAFEGPSMLALGGLLAAGALFGAVGTPVAAGMAALGMTAIGLGLGGFFAGIAVADKGISFMVGDGEPGATIKTLMVNMGAGLGGMFEGVKDVTMADIGKLPLAAGAAASSMIAIAGGSGIAAILGGLTKVVNFFSGGTNPMDFVMEIGEKADEVDAGASAIEKVAEALKRLAGLDITIKSNFEDFADDLKKSVPIIEAAINGDDGGWFGSEIKGINSRDVNYEQAAARIKTLRGAVDGDINASIKLDVSTKIEDMNASMGSLIGESNRLLVENNVLLDLILKKEPSNQQVPALQPPVQNSTSDFDQSGDAFRQMQAI
jgi:hypothetical protein